MVCEITVPFVVQSVCWVCWVRSLQVCAWHAWVCVCNNVCELCVCNVEE